MIEGFPHAIKFAVVEKIWSWANRLRYSTPPIANRDFQVKPTTSIHPDRLISRVFKAIFK
jgi:hypothetical protein